MYEHIIKARLVDEIEDMGGFHNMQLGFRVNRSTIDVLRKVVDIAKARGGTPPK